MSLGSNGAYIISNVYIHDIFQMAVFSQSFLGEKETVLVLGKNNITFAQFDVLVINLKMMKKCEQNEEK